MYWLVHETYGPIFWMDRTGGYKGIVSDQRDFPSSGATNLSAERRLSQVEVPRWVTSYGLWWVRTKQTEAW